MSKKTTTTKAKNTKAKVQVAKVAKPVAKSVINLKELELPNGVEMAEKKTCVTFVRGEKKAILKGKALEVTSALKELGNRLKVFTDEQIEKCHLGSVQGIVADIENSVDLNNILAKYFKQSGKKAAKVAVA